MKKEEKEEKKTCFCSLFSVYRHDKISSENYTSSTPTLFHHKFTYIFKPVNRVTF